MNSGTSGTEPLNLTRLRKATPRQARKNYVVLRKDKCRLGIRETGRLAKNNEDNRTNYT
jgi:hypothetical protein